jgi:uncharacterized protein (DUF433 family)
MARYALNLPVQLKQEAEAWASRQGVSLNQFITWSVAEKVTALRQGVDDPRFPGVTYRRGASGWPQPVVRGTGVRVQTLAIAAEQWGMTPAQIAAEYGLSEAQVREALDFFAAHRAEIEAQIEAESRQKSNG